MRQPNVVLILVDDMGFSDIGCYGGEVRTPNLDRLARQGVREIKAIFEKNGRKTGVAAMLPE